MRIKTIYISFIMVLLLLTTAVFAEDVITYRFDKVEVSYAAEFVVYPVDVAEDNWLAKLAGGTDQPVTVLLGDVLLTENGFEGFSEQYIKVTGKNGSERFLINSASNDYDRGLLKSFFWSAKQLVGNEVVKDFTGPIKSLTLYRVQDGEDGYEKIYLSASDNGEGSCNEFWYLDEPKGNYYQADLSTLRHAGEIGTR